MLFNTHNHLLLFLLPLFNSLTEPHASSPISLPLSRPQKAVWLRAHPQVSDQPAGAQSQPHRRLQVGCGHVYWHRRQVWTPSPTLHSGDSNRSGGGGGPLQCEDPLEPSMVWGMVKGFGCFVPAHCLQYFKLHFLKMVFLVYM